MNRTHRFLIAALLALAPAGALAAPAGDPLEQGFRNPPNSAKPQTWWHWMNGNITKDGITRDLEAMKQMGLGGAEIFNVDCGIPAGPVKLYTPEWRQLMAHAFREADRLGLELCMHNCAGWSSSGGPWVRPEEAMQLLTWSETRVKGPAAAGIALPQPPTKLGFYRDVAVLAFPTPAADQGRMADRLARVTASSERFDAAKVTDGNPDTFAMLTGTRPGKPQYVQLEFKEPFTAQCLEIVPGPGAAGPGEIQVSDDGQNYRTVRAFSLPEQDINRSVLSAPFAPTTGRFFRLTFSGGGRARSVNLAEIELLGDRRIEDFSGKSGVRRAEYEPAGKEQAPANSVVPLNGVLDLTGKMDAAGKLAWDVPAGEWTVMRLGYTPTGKDNHPAPPSGTGLEIDKLSREAAQMHWAAAVEPLLKEAGLPAGRGLRDVLIDSYEVGCQNWTPKMREEFRARRGYDPLPFLPAMAGHIVGSAVQSERFLWDVRKTLADLYADNYFGYFAQMAHQRGMLFSVEPYGNGNFDCLTAGADADVPMTEFWAGSGGDFGGAKMVASIAHTRGRQLVGAESFTAGPENGAWRNDPYSIKALGDLEWCAGVNRFIFHRWAMQPWADVKPGMTMGPFGMHFERTITWAKQAPAWTGYLARGQFLLQAGRFAADLCYYAGESSPTGLRLNPPPPAGYDYDGCDTDVLMKMDVKGGKLVLPGGMEYRALVLPNSTAMLPAVLQKVRALVQAGATVVGPKPDRSPSLQGYPECDVQVARMADEVWGNCDGKTVTEHAFGAGKVVWGKPLAEVLAVPPDFECTAAGDEQPVVHFIHRIVGGTDLYFVANQLPATAEVTCTFRVAGRQPELWHADTGKIEPCLEYTPANGRTQVPLRLDPRGSVFVVFRRPASAGADPITSVKHQGPPAPAEKPAELVILKAEYGAFDAGLDGFVNVTDKVRAMVRAGQRAIPATNTLAGTDPANNVVKEMRIDFVLDGKEQSKTVTENETLEVPAGADVRKALYGILPTPEEENRKLGTVDVTAILQARVKDGHLRVTADNTLAGDPANLIRKELHVEYTVGGVHKTAVVSEGAMLDLPPSEGGAAPPTWDLAAGADGRPVLTAWEPGSYTVAMASGKTAALRAGTQVRALPVAGPWEVRFPAGWGAPASVTLPKLISWTESPTAGVRYFSGTAEYVKDVQVPALAAGTPVMLDLGQVKNFAEVSVNGRALGVLWKPPFRVDVTGLLRPGANRLVVRVTNLWPNRLIGDEQQPPDADFNPGGALKAWPDWFLKGQPRPSKGRLTFTTWQHYTKDSPLLESGLLGPVVVRVGEKLQ